MKAIADLMRATHSGMHSTLHASFAMTVLTAKATDACSYSFDDYESEIQWKETFTVYGLYLVWLQKPWEIDCGADSDLML